jgi:hypothetical protein
MSPAIRFGVDPPTQGVRMLWSLLAWLRCRLGHEWELEMTDSRLWLQCLRCGRATSGWDVTPTPLRFTRWRGRVTRFGWSISSRPRVARG